MNNSRLYNILLAPHVSEKSSLIGELNNQYTFKVAKDATKPEIKTAVEELFDVIVLDLQVLNVKGKTKRSVGGKIRRRPSWKKVYVRLEEGHEIDFADIS
jgi:large subunit ribosomal protein L23